MSSRGKGKWKGKGKMKDPPPPPKKFAEVFELEIKKLHQKVPSPGTYKLVLTDITNGIIRRTKSQWEKADGSEPRTPQTEQGKLVLPKTNEVFVVAVTNTDDERVLYLFNWKDLYNTAFYAQECWYVFIDTDTSTLPPPEQFPYIDVRGQGIFQLHVYSSYGDMGIKNIMLGPPAIDMYVHKLYTIKVRLQRSSNKLKLDKDLKDELGNGPLTFAPVVISETSRFHELQVFMLDNISLNIRVPISHTQFFTSWSKLCHKLKDGKGYTLIIQGQDDIHLTWEQVKSKIAVMLWGTYLLP